MLKLLFEQRLCVCELAKILDKSQPCISQHLRRFKELDLVVEERVEQWSYFQINLDVFQAYTQLLQELKNIDYCSLGLTDLKERLTEAKRANLCQLKKG